MKQFEIMVEAHKRTAQAKREDESLDYRFQLGQEIQNLFLELKDLYSKWCEISNRLESPLLKACRGLAEDLIPLWYLDQFSNSFETALFEKRESLYKIYDVLTGKDKIQNHCTRINPERKAGIVVLNQCCTGLKIIKIMEVTYKGFYYYPLDENFMPSRQRQFDTNWQVYYQYSEKEIRDTWDNYIETRLNDLSGRWFDITTGNIEKAIKECFPDWLVYIESTIGKGFDFVECDEHYCYMEGSDTFYFDTEIDYEENAVKIENITRGEV